MGRRGPAKTPDAVKKLRGTAGKKDRRSAPAAPAPAFAGTIAKMPPHIAENADAKRRWEATREQLRKAKVLTAADVVALEGLCVSYARAMQADRDVLKYGTMITGSTGQLVASPALAVSRTSWSEVRRFLIELGMTPASRSRIKAPDAPKESPKEETPEGFLFGKGVIGAIGRRTA